MCACACDHMCMCVHMITYVCVCVCVCRLTVAELQAMIDEADKDGDGLVSRDEFISTMFKTALFS